MKALIIHHLQSEWKVGFKNCGTTLEEQVLKVKKHLEHTKYDKVILTLWGTPFLEDEELDELEDYITDIEEYGYGWERDMLPELEKYGTWCEGGNHSEIVFIPEWMEQLRNYTVDICGAFEGECIEDLEIALNFLNIEFNKLKHLIL